MTTLTYDELHERALERATRERLPVMQVSETCYSVPSRTVKRGQWRFVHLMTDGALVCDCEGHTYYHCCTHTASVELALGNALPVYQVPTPTAPPVVCCRCRQHPPRRGDTICRECAIDDLYGDR